MKRLTSNVPWEMYSTLVKMFSANLKYADGIITYEILKHQISLPRFVIFHALNPSTNESQPGEYFFDIFIYFLPIRSKWQCSLSFH